MYAFSPDIESDGADHGKQENDKTSSAGSTPEKKAPPPAPPKPKPKPKSKEPGDSPSGGRKAAPSFVKKLDNMQVTEGDTVKLEVTCDVACDITWLCGDRVVTSQSFPSMTSSSEGNTHRLEIPSVKLMDSALYTCEASNEVGKVTCSSDVLVMRK